MISKATPLFLLLLFAPLTAAQTASPSPTPAAAPTQSSQKSAYDTLLERVKQSDQSVDFKALRLAYTETDAYSPYGGDRASRQAMFAAINAKEYEKVLAPAEKILFGNYLDINGHFGCFVAHRALGHTDKTAYHKFVFEGLLNSIKNSGDGLTAKTAFVVISVDEEYAFLNWLGLRTSSQALVNEDGHSYDRMSTTDPKTGAEVSYFFNIDKPFNWLGKSIKKN
jgi:hypothetical protein